MSSWQAGVSCWLSGVLPLAGLRPFLAVKRFFPGCEETFEQKRSFTEMHTRKHTDVQLGGRLTNMPSNSYPVDLPPQQYARSPFNSMPFFFKPLSKMPPEKHKNVQRPMSILLHRSNNILQQASGKTYTKRETNTIKNSGDTFTTIKNTWSS